MKYRKPLRIFEKAGVVNPKKSYYVTLENVVNSDKQDIKTMVDQARYFSMFAPRQSGKTTFLEGLREELHNDPTYIIIILNFQDYKHLDKSRFYSEFEKKLYQQLIERLEDVNCEKTETVKHYLALPIRKRWHGKFEV